MGTVADTPLGGMTQAAVMVLLFEENAASEILSGLSPAELRTLGQELAALGEVDPAHIASAITAFADHAEPCVLPPAIPPAAIRRLFEGAVGPLKTEGLMREIAPARTEPQGPLALLPWLAPEALAALAKGEAPQVIAVLLCQAEASVAARALAAMPEPVQADVVHRIATLGPVAREALAILAELVERRLEQCYGALPLGLGGVAEAAAIINEAARSVEQRVLPELGKRDRALARRVEEAMFRFDMLFELDTQAIGRLLREVESDVLVDALKGLTEDRREPFLSAMSSRAADGVRDEIEARGRVKLGDAETAQRLVVAAARRLAADGEISFGSGGDEYV